MHPLSVHIWPLEQEEEEEEEEREEEMPTPLGLIPHKCPVHYINGRQIYIGLLFLS